MSELAKGFSIKVDEALVEKKKEEEKRLSEQGITRETFQIAVMENMVDKKSSFISAVYQTLDEFLKREMDITGVVLSCKKGCSFCCYQIITCTDMEIKEIIRFIKEQPRKVRRSITRDIKKATIKWENYFENNETTLTRNPFQMMNDWLGKPCPFLNKKEGSCNIYPVRIIDCRTATSLTPCSLGEIEGRIPCELDWPGPGRHRFQCESWANNMILDEQMKKLGQMAVTPLHHWLLYYLKKGELY